MIMDSVASARIRANLNVQLFNPHLSHFKFVELCATCRCAPVKRYSDPLSSSLKDRNRHSLANSPNWAPALSPVAACRPRLSEGTPACSLWIFKMSCLSSLRSALTSSVYPLFCEKMRGSSFPLFIPADSERFLLLLSESSKFLLSLIFMLRGCC